MPPGGVRVCRRPLACSRTGHPRPPGVRVPLGARTSESAAGREPMTSTYRVCDVASRVIPMRRTRWEKAGRVVLAECCGLGGPRSLDPSHVPITPSAFVPLSKAREHSAERERLTFEGASRMTPYSRSMGRWRWAVRCWPSECPYCAAAMRAGSVMRGMIREAKSLASSRALSSLNMDSGSLGSMSGIGMKMEPMAQRCWMLRKMASR